MTTLRAAALAARDRLLAAGASSDEIEAEVEAEVLLRYALDPKNGAPKAHLYARWEDAVPAGVARCFEAALRRRLAREPTAYITGRQEFYALDFRVSRDVLIPRPETEQVVETAVALARSPTRPRLRIVDAGTGSGAIAIALAKALPAAEIVASDVSGAALAVARDNAQRHGVSRRIAFRRGDLLTPVHDYVDLIVANLPYVTTADWSRLAPELRDYEPRIALDGGADGLDLIRALLRQAPRYLLPGGCIVLEIGDGQSLALSAFVREAMPAMARCSIAADFAGIPRVATIRP